MTTNERILAYGTNEFHSLKSFEGTCEGEESRFRAKLMKIQLAKIDGTTDATAVIFEKVGIGTNIGHLIIEEYTTDVDKQSRIAIHKTEGEPFICEGAVYINNKPTKILVFREKN